MRSKWSGIVPAALALSLLVTASGSAQIGTTDEAKRKVRSKSLPGYPDLAKRMNVTGKVKIEVVITPDGRVKSSRVLGGHPLLVQACQDAVKEWKFAAGTEETTQIVEFEFKGSSE
ncbi:MAG TPA: energy transducer TonB [Candidatus Acidoferrum sp.]|jgi:TonB family protein